MVTVLRLGHRAGRDNRMSTHVGLTARQWGADRVIYSGDKDSNLLDSVKSTNEEWGGSTEFEFRKDWKNVIKDFDGYCVHLTMYGLNIEEIEPEIKSKVENQDLLLVVGSQKVPNWVYKNVDINVGVGNQPHSEVAALAVFLDRFNGIKTEFEGADKKVDPSDGRKIVQDV